MKTGCSVFIILFVVIQVSAQQTGSFTDQRDAKTYAVIEIGGRMWMAENLAFKTKKGAYGYARDEQYVPEFGYLYRYYSLCNVCPEGWKLPSRKDYKRLLENLNVADSLCFDALAESGSSGFNAKLSGWNHYLGLGNGQIHETTSFWTRTLNIVFFGAFRMELIKKGKVVKLSADYKDYGYSVRCILKK
jgi:uncharacterized protein (TIGR02145 family)